jgi:hypothetical protein
MGKTMNYLQLTDNAIRGGKPVEYAVLDYDKSNTSRKEIINNACITQYQ